MEASIKTLAVIKRWQHHTKSGGFDRLAEVAGWETQNRVDKAEKWARWRLRTIDRWWKQPVSALPSCYEYGDYLAERRAFWRASRGKFGIVHYLYGDEQMNWGLENRKKFAGRLAATFHLPWFRALGRHEQLRTQLRSGLDMAFAVSSELAHDLCRVLPSNRVHFVPHGVDVEVFSPSPAERAPGCLRLLTVGEHMRDLDLVHRIADRAAWEKWPVQFTYVGPAAVRAAFAGCDNVIFRSGLSEAELVSEYRNADALLLPVIAATANNSLLEALACGLPAISSELPGIVDYMDNRSGWLLPPGDRNAWMELVEAMSLDPGICRVKRSEARQMGERFNWSLVALKYQEILRS